MGEQPAVGEVIAFMDATCLLKSVTFKNWTNDELLAFWLNVYHCLLVHAILIFGAPKSRSEMVNFRSRVSYLIGPSPLSLREIETAILQVPTAYPKAARQARSRARQLLGICGWCRRRATKSVVSDSKRSPSQAGGLGQLPSDRSLIARGCFPKMPLPSPFVRTEKGQTCLYLGGPPEALPSIKQDLRVALILNRGTLSCLSSIPVFDAARLHSELRDMSRQFVRQFVEFQMKDGRPVQATLPWCCKGILQQLNDDSAELLRFISQFYWEDASAQPQNKVQLKFKKFPEGPRKRSQFIQAIYEDSSLQQTPVSYGPEVATVLGTAKALAALAEAPRATPLRSTSKEKRPAKEGGLAVISL